METHQPGVPNTLAACSKQVGEAHLGRYAQGLGARGSGHSWEALRPLEGGGLFCFVPIKYFILLPYQKQYILKANDLRMTAKEKRKPMREKMD